ncbi:hypothetical protein LUZ60_016094 [Juncus effusus]|nr:hypothetical protein LUZ60_016094 [Juncus effusus]
MNSSAEPDLPLLLILRTLTAQFSAALSPKFTLVLPSSPLAASARAVLVSGGQNRVDSSLLDQYPSLKLVVTTSAGVNHIDLAECGRRGIQVSNAGEVFSADVADYAVVLLIDVLRRITMADRYVKSGLWPVRGDYPLGSKLGGKRVGIVGLGSIGSEIAKRLEAFNCFISYFSRSPKPTFPSYKYFPNIYDLATETDVLIVSCALTKETHHIVNKQVLQNLGKEGIIVNIGRGAVIDEVELVRALVRGEIRGAGLDVYEHEPNVPKELVEMENVVLTPHRAVFTSESMNDVVNICVENLEKFFANKPLVSPVKTQ